MAIVAIAEGFLAHPTPGSLARKSNGHWYAAYHYPNPVTWRSDLAVDFSVDGGATWNNSLTITDAGGVINYEHPAIAFDSADGLHLVYTIQDTGLATYAIGNRALPNGGAWSGEVIVSAGSLTVPGAGGRWPGLALDSLGELHLTYCAVENTGAWSVYYRLYSGGAWGAIEMVNTILSPGANVSVPRIAVDQSDDPHVVWDMIDGGGQFRCYYNMKTLGAWIGQEVIWHTPGVAHFSPYLSVDLADVVHVSSQKGNYGYYSRRAGGAWFGGFEVPIPAVRTSTLPSISLDAADNIYFHAGHDPAAPPSNLYHTWASGWLGAWTDVMDLAGAWVWFAVALHSLWPQVGGLRTNRPTTGYAVIFANEDPLLTYGIYFNDTGAWPPPVVASKSYIRNNNAKLRMMAKV